MIFFPIRLPPLQWMKGEDGNSVFPWNIWVSKVAEKCIQIVIYILFSLLWKNQNYLYFVLCIFSSAIPKSIALFFSLKDSTQSPS